VKKLVIAVAIMLMLAGATISVLKWLGIGPFGDPAEVEATGTTPDEPLHFVTMDVLVIPIFQGEKVAATVQIQLKLEATNLENASEIARLLPRLNDAFLRDLYGFIPRHLRKKERLDLALIKDRLQMVGDKVAGPGVIKSVLVQAVLENPSR
jgi:flagellar basal body-associated protein FliL